MNIKSNKKQKSLFIYITIFVFITVINSILALFEIPSPIGSSELYFAIPFMIVFALWFGAWGVIAAYFGCFIGAGILSGIPLDVSLYFSLVDVWQVLIPLMAFKKLDADVGLRKKRDFLTFLIFGWILNSVVGAVWGASTLALGGLASWNEVPSIIIGWIFSNLIVIMAITPLLLRYATPYIQKAELYVEKYWY